ncbi:hypothetical protein GCM10023084_61370 [Streptomyces lacrimifluminis]|uniref:Uncharacterized protein n=2 Tax=Streptomyces lacrimifluminis TaxID=1500077 RepID=A0A917L4J1_9ACTN|nr:hypothetical protein GCM10012282_46210 [Streptomyces lacrimifluminis]
MLFVEDVRIALDDPIDPWSPEAGEPERGPLARGCGRRRGIDNSVPPQRMRDFWRDAADA